MTIIHANDPTTKVLSLLYEDRENLTVHITEKSSNITVRHAIREDNLIMMLGHGNQYGLFSTPDKNGNYKRFLITDRHVQFLRNKTCIGIISELQEAIDYNIPATKEEIDLEQKRFTLRLKECIDRYGLAETPMRMRELNDVKSELTSFNYNNLFYFK